MFIILEIIGAIMCLNCALRILFAISVYAGLKGANKWTAQGEQIEVNKVNLKKATNTLKYNAILLVVGIILIILGENFGR